MAVFLTACNCPEAIPETLCAVEPAVVESEFCIPGGIPQNATNLQVFFPDATLPLGTLAIELICCDLVVVCGYITKRVSYTSTAGTTVTRDFNVPIQAQVKVNNPTNIPLSTNNLSIASATVCNGCFRLLSACVDPTNGTVVFHRLREKDILQFEFAFRP